MRRLLRTLLVVLPLLAVLFLALWLSRASRLSPPAPHVSNPNGYNDFVQAAALLTGDVSDAITLGHDDLAALIATNAEPLRLVRLGLSRQCLWPSEARTAALTNFAALSHDLVSEKRLVHLLAAEGRLAEMDNRPADAARSYMNAVRFGNEISRGGLVISRLVGIACEAIGITPLTKLAPMLDCDQRRRLIKELIETDRAAVTWAEVMKSERWFGRHQTIQRIHNPITFVIEWWQSRSAIKLAQGRHDRVAARLRLLAVELALQCYVAEHGRAPLGLEEIPQLQGLPI